MVYGLSVEVPVKQFSKCWEKNGILNFACVWIQVIFLFVCISRKATINHQVKQKCGSLHPLKHMKMD